ncbi:MAG: hypothetical protein ACRDYX_18510 [Egibacteraceae bacterium]
MDLRSGGAVVALVVVLTGCSLSGRSEQKAEQQARNDAETITIQSELAKVPGVVDVKVLYSNYITEPGAGSANLIVEHGTDLERIADLTVGVVWRSQLDPLKSIRVGVLEDKDRTVGVVRSYSIFDDKAELEAKYGPRPVGAVTRGTGRG